MLDEVDMGWYNNVAPGFVCVGRKPRPFVDERNAICCGVTLVLRRAHIV